MSLSVFMKAWSDSSLRGAGGPVNTAEQEAVICYSVCLKPLHDIHIYRSVLCWELVSWCLHTSVSLGSGFIASVSSLYRFLHLYPDKGKHSRQWEQKTKAYLHTRLKLVSLNVWHQPCDQQVNKIIQEDCSDWLVPPPTWQRSSSTQTWSTPWWERLYAEHHYFLLWVVCSDCVFR